MQDYYKQFVRVISIYGRKWSKMCTDSSIGLPSNLKGSNLKEKWKSIDINVTMWISSSEDDSDPNDFEDFNGEEYHGYD
jgi:hypothetical protein